MLLRNSIGVLWGTRAKSFSEPTWTSVGQHIFGLVPGNRKGASFLNPSAHFWYLTASVTIRFCITLDQGFHDVTLEANSVPVYWWWSISKPADRRFYKPRRSRTPCHFGRFLTWFLCKWGRPRMPGWQLPRSWRKRITTSMLARNCGRQAGGQFRDTGNCPNNQFNTTRWAPRARTFWMFPVASDRRAALEKRASVREEFTSLSGPSFMRKDPVLNYVGMLCDLNAYSARNPGRFEEKDVQFVCLLKRHTAMTSVRRNLNLIFFVCPSQVATLSHFSGNTSIPREKKSDSSRQLFFWWHRKIAPKNHVALT